MQFTIPSPRRIRSTSAAAALSTALLAAVSFAVEPVPFLDAVAELAPESPPEEPGPTEPADAEEAVEPAAFESRVMEFPETVEPQQGTVVAERVIGDRVVGDSLPVPEAAGDVADVAGNRDDEPVPSVDVEEITGEEIMIEEPAAFEIPVLASSGKWFNSGFWYASGESLWYDRSRNKRVTIGIEERLPNIQFTTLAQPFDTAPGVRATFGRSLGRDYLDRDRLIEFTYTGALLWQGVDGWNSVAAEPTLLSPLGFNVPGFNYANTYRTSLDSNFNSFEVNFRLRRRLGRDQLVLSPNGGWSRHAERGFLPGLILGPRLARVDEDFWFRSRRNGVSADTFSGDYDITTQNWLLGMNIGGELVSRNEFYYWGLRGRAAPALTFASAQQVVSGINRTNDPPNPVVPSPVYREDRNTQTSPGFIGDLTLFAGWNITPNLSLKLGYDFLWVAGIATATRQFNLDDLRQNPMDAGGQTFFNGVSFGLEGSW